MRIAYITSMKRGLPSFIYRQIKTLFAHGLTVDIFTTKYAPGMYMPHDDWNCTHFRAAVVLLLQPFYFVRYFVHYVKLLPEAIWTNSLVDFLIAFNYIGKMKQCHRIHCNEGIHPFFIGYYCSKIRKLPLSVTIHADTFYVNPNPKLARKALKYCDAIITISNYNKDILTNDYGISPEKVHVIRLGVDLNNFSKYDRKCIMIVGQYAKRKGHEDLFKAFTMLKRHDVDLWVVGSGTWGTRDYVDVQYLVRKYKIDENVIFFENISEKFLRLLYSMCTVFCLPSKVSSDGNREGLPVSLIEAMASYKPVVSTNHTGIPELVNKILVPEGDWVKLSEALADLLDKSDEELSRMGQENRQIVEDRYSDEVNTGKLVEFFIRSS